MATELRLIVDTSIHDLEAIKRCCYSLADKANARLTRSSAGLIEVLFTANEGAIIDDEFERSFERKLIDFDIRVSLERQTGTIRDLIYRQAFIEADF